MPVVEDYRFVTARLFAFFGVIEPFITFTGGWFGADPSAAEVPADCPTGGLGSTAGMCWQGYSEEMSPHRIPGR
jgi:hypothetical protein